MRDEAMKWEIRHLDLKDDQGDLQGTGNIRLYLWWGRLLLGHVIVYKEQLPMSQNDLISSVLTVVTHTLQGYLQDGSTSPLKHITQLDHTQVWQGDSQATTPLDKPLDSILSQLKKQCNTAAIQSVSVIVCTRNRIESLRRCLDSLRAVKAQPHQIIVVDNAPDKSAADLVRGYGRVEYVHEPHPGLCAARNAGILTATGDIVAFIDDDTIVEPDWLEWLVGGFAEKRVMAVTGHVLPAELATRAQLVFQESSCGFGWGYAPRNFDRTFWHAHKKHGAPVWTIGAGANMAFRRDIFRQVGLFDERLDPGAAGCSGDSEMWYRILANGWDCRYEPASVVHHFHRREVKELRRQMFYYMRGHVTALLIQFQTHGHWGNLYRAFYLLPRYYLSCLLKLRSRRNRKERCTLVNQILGCAAGYNYFLWHCLSPPYRKDIS